MTRHQDSCRVLILLPVFLLTGLSWLTRGEVVASFERESPSHSVPAGFLSGLIDVTPTKAKALTITQTIPTTDEEFKKLRESILKKRTDNSSVVDEFLKERHSATRPTV